MPRKLKISEKTKCGVPPFTFHREFKKRFRSLFGVETVYHYTTTPVLLELAKDDACLYATHCSALNDDMELEVGVRYALQEYLPTHQKKLYCRLKHDWPEVITALESKEEPFSPKCSASTFLLTPWVMSFSRESDSLNQWIAYTNRKEGGFAIGFDFHKLEKAVESEVVVRRSKYEFDKRALDYELHFLPCLYLDKSDKHQMQLIHKFLEFLFVDYFEYQLKKFKIHDRKDVAYLIVAFANLFGAIAKNASFKSENEFRLLMLVKNKEYLRKVVFVGGKPRLKIPIFSVVKEDVRSLIKNIVISPHGDIRFLRSMVDVIGIKYNLDIDVYKSESPFNGR